MTATQGDAHQPVGGDRTVDAAPTVQRSTDRFPQPSRLGCPNGCDGYTHDPGCAIAETMRQLHENRRTAGMGQPRTDLPCRFGYGGCKSMGVPALQNGPEYCGCVDEGWVP